MKKKMSGEKQLHKVYEPRITVVRGRVPIERKTRKGYVNTVIANAELELVKFSVGDLQYVEITDCSVTTYHKLKKHFESHFLVQYATGTQTCYISKGVS